MTNAADNTCERRYNGGWHDAGDLRKWVDATLMNLFGLVALARNLPSFTPTSFPPTSSSQRAVRQEPAQPAALLDESRIREHLLPQNAGLRRPRLGRRGRRHTRGDNSDNHWTDNVRSRAGGAGDDRWINDGETKRHPGHVHRRAGHHGAALSRELRPKDPDYAATCLSAAMRCWKARRIREATPPTSPGGPLPPSRCRKQPRSRVRSGDDAPGEQARQPADQEPDERSVAVSGFFPMWTGGEPAFT